MTDRFHGEADLTQLLAILWRRKWIWLAVMSLGTVVTVLLLMQIPKKYQATARILVATETPRMVENTALLPERDDTQSINSELEVISARDLAPAVVKRLTADQVQRLKVSVPAWQGVLPDSWQAILGFGADASAISEQQLADQLHGLVRTARIKRTRVLTVSVRHEDPDMAAAVANGWAKAYTDASQAHTKHLLADAVRFLEDRLTELNDHVARAEAEVTAWITAKGLVETGDTDLQQEMLVRLQESRVLALAEQSEARARYRAAEAALKKNILDQVEPLSALAQQLTQQAAQLDRDLAAYRDRYGLKHPVRQQAEQARQALQRRLDQEAKRRVAMLKAAYRAAETKWRALDAAVQKFEAQMRAKRQGVAELRRLEREAAVAREIYLAQRSQADYLREMAHLVPAQARVIEAAQAPGAAHWPPMKVAASASLVFWAFVGIGIAVIRDRLDQRLISEEQAKLVSDLDVLVGLHWDRRGTGLAQEIRGLSVALEPAAHSISVLVSAFPAEGKTTTTLAFARDLAAHGSTLVVDADVSKRQLSQQLGQADAPGWSDLMVGDGKLSDWVIASDSEGLALLPAGHKGQVIGPELARVMTEMAGQYDHVVFDTPPILAVSDALRLARLADHVVLVVRDHVTPIHLLRRALARMATAGIAPAGLIYNGIRQKQGRYGGYYGQYYATKPAKLSAAS